MTIRWIRRRRREATENEKGGGGGGGRRWVGPGFVLSLTALDAE